MLELGPGEDSIFRIAPLSLDVMLVSSRILSTVLIDVETFAFDCPERSGHKALGPLKLPKMLSTGKLIGILLDFPVGFLAEPVELARPIAVRDAVKFKGALGFAGTPE